MKRVTIHDIAVAAGVSPSAVSFALNDRPGVSDDTRARIKQVADELGWTPNVAALALSGRRAGAVGLVIVRTRESLSGERFFLSLIAGVEQVLTPRDLSLVLQMVPTFDAELAVLRKWWAQRRVDGVLLVDPRADDPRGALLAGLAMPGVWVGAPAAWPTHGLASVQVDDAGAMRTVVDHLAHLGRRRVAHVGGALELLHTGARVRALQDAARERGIEVVSTPSADFTENAGHHATAELLGGATPPDAIIYDNEILALGGLAAAAGAGLAVPGDVAMVSFEDSPVCKVVTPALTALRRDPAELGIDATRLLLRALDGQPGVRAAEPVPELVVRASTSASVRGSSRMPARTPAGA